MNLVKTSYDSSDVKVLMKDLSSLVKPTDLEQRENSIASGLHYSEMLPRESVPTIENFEAYDRAVAANAHKVAVLISAMCTKLCMQHGFKFVLISLARAGTPIGILIKRRFKEMFGVDLPHYSVSILRDKGLDENALNYIKSQHPDISVDKFQFVDGWTGKGAISTLLDESVRKLIEKDHHTWGKLSSDLAVILDPSGLSTIFGSREDFTIPSACLLSTGSGLFSRPIHSDRFLEADEFHGSVFFSEFKGLDKSNDFIARISNEFEFVTESEISKCIVDSLGDDVRFDRYKEKYIDPIIEAYRLDDISQLKPGLNETVRLLLLRGADRVILHKDFVDNPCADIEYITQLCVEKNIPIDFADIGTFRVCGIYKGNER